MTGYVELHAHSCYSLLDGVPSPEQLVQQCGVLGIEDAYVRELAALVEAACDRSR